MKKAPLPVLDGVSFDVEPGAFVVLLGPSGCGKSMLLRLVAGIEPPNEGQISVDSAPSQGPHPSRGLVFQDPTLYPWRSVLGNVAVGPEALSDRPARIRADIRCDRPYPRHREALGVVADRRTILDLLGTA